MSVRLIRLGKRKVWQARVALHRLRSSAVKVTKAEARKAEAALLQELRRRAGDLTAAGRVPATLRTVFEAYTQDLENRGKSSDTVGRAAQTATAIERLVPNLLAKSVSTLTDADIFAFRQAREGQGCKPGTINRDLRTLSAMLRKARPDFRFPRRHSRASQSAPYAVRGMNSSITKLHARSLPVGATISISLTFRTSDDRGMDMRFWLEQGKAEMTGLA